MKISVLRLGHRLPRDERITTHVCLVARAFGAEEVIYSGQHDGSLESSVLGIVENWGGKFSIKYEKDFINIIKNYKGRNYLIVHLTMYGMPLNEKITEIRARIEKIVKKTIEKNNKKILVIVGAEKVPTEVYELADFNISITNQPHSEVAALAILLDRLQDGEELEREWNEKFKGKIKIEPNEKGKEMTQQIKR